MEYNPQDISNELNKGNIRKKEAIQYLISLIEYNSDVEIRKECIKIIEELNLRTYDLFKLLENLLISDSNEAIRNAAAIAIKKCFPVLSYNPLVWTLENDSCYECLKTALDTIKKDRTNETKSFLVEKIQKIKLNEFKRSIRYLNPENLGIPHLTEIYSDYLTSLYLREVFPKVKFYFRNGLVYKIDFSNISTHNFGWRDKNALQDTSILNEISNLKNLESLNPFPFDWCIQNRISLNCQIELFRVIKNLDQKFCKPFFLRQIKNIEHDNFLDSINDLVKKDHRISDFKISKLFNILISYLTIIYLEKKNPNIKYELAEGIITHLKLDGTPLIRLPEIVCYLTKLKKLSLKSCKLYSLSDSIYHLSSLIDLDLENNNLSNLPSAINKLKNLENLNLSKNQISILSPSFGKLLNLKSLNLSHNDLTEIPPSLSTLTYLISLNLSCNHLQSLPEDLFNDLDELKYLNLYLNDLKRIPDSLINSSSLNYLNIENNKIDQLPLNIGNLANLEIFKAGENRLVDLPNSISKLRKLQILDLRWNRIKILPSDLSSLNSLQELLLTRNKLRALPNSLNQLSSLKKLDLTFNLLKTLPHSLDGLKNLEVLILYNNKLESVPESLGHITSLIYLNLWGNKLTNIPESIGSLINLEVLCLNGNELLQIPDSFENLSSLEKLSLNNNQLSEIPQIVYKLTALKELSYKWNKF